MSCTVTVCRDCCCGSTDKHPGVDHDGQLDALRAGLAGAGRLVVSQCLLACERSNVVVVGPTPTQRAAGVKPVWLSQVLTAWETQAVVDWVQAGGPGAAPLPLELEGKTDARPELCACDPC